MTEKNIINDYINGAGFGLLTKKYSMGKKRIKNILLTNGIKIRNRGGVKKADVISHLPEFHVKCGKDEVVYAQCKKTGKKISDYKNKSGALSRHIKTLGVEPLSYHDSKIFFSRNNEHWFQQYFNFVIEKINKKKKISCPHCNWYTYDVDNRSGALNKHLKTKHKFNRKKRLKTDEKVTCSICKGEFKSITNTHLLKKHGITMEKYKLKYPRAKITSSKTNKKLRKLAKRNKNLFRNKYKSKAEISLYKWILKYYPKAENGNRSLLNGVELDIVIPELKIAIEYNGLYYHTEWFGGKSKYFHKNKQELCEEIDYKLIHIFEDEWELKNDIVKSKLKNLLGINDKRTKLHGRECIVREIDKELAKDFIDKNHIQGYSNSTISLGAYHKNNLIGVMCFTKRQNNNYELSRFCTLINHNVIGIGGKLFKFFTRKFDYNTVISFADLRWTINKSDNLYTKLGFDFVCELHPDYCYYNSSINRLRRFHKFNFRKKILLSRYPNKLNKNMTETEMVKTIGFDRIWDCGKIKFIYS